MLMVESTSVTSKGSLIAWNGLGSCAKYICSACEIYMDIDDNKKDKVSPAFAVEKFASLFLYLSDGASIKSSSQIFALRDFGKVRTTPPSINSS